MRIHCLTHVPFEGPGRIAEWAKTRGHELLIIRSDLVDTLPDANETEMLVVMGGPMSVNDALPWLQREAALVEGCLKLKRPLLGVCLGAQLLAKVLGARVFASGLKEIGWWPVTSVGNSETPGPSLPHKFTPLHWHGETFDLPQGARHLAQSEAIPNQAFLAQPKAVGVQFHLEATPQSVQEIVNGARADIEVGPWQQTEAALLEARTARSAELEMPCYALLDWLIG